VHEHFDIGIARAKPVAVSLERLLQFVEVVDFTVGDNLDVAGFVQDRLLAAGEIDDGQAPHAKTDAGNGDAALFIRAAMMQHAHHPLELGGRDLLIQVAFNDANDSTHIASAP
jgi:hypothetical protein